MDISVTNSFVYFATSTVSSIMFSISKKHGAVLLLVLTQCLVFGSMDHDKNRTNCSTETIGNYLKLPWMDGLDWLVHSSDSPDGIEVKKFIRAIIIAGEPWATQVLDDLSKDQLEWEKRLAHHAEIYNECTKAHADNDTHIEDGHCRVSAVGTDSDQNDQVVDDVTQRTPVGSTDFTTSEISTIVFFSTVIVVLLGCTICDFVKRNRPGECSSTVNTLAKFSLYSNALSLLNTKATVEAMPAIHGLRCLGFWSVMFGHRYAIKVTIMHEKVTLLDFIRGKNTLFGVYFEMVSFAIDTFCVIAGFLTAYLFLKTKKSGLKFNVLTMYLYRYLRLTPCVAVVMLFVVVFYHRCGSGPLWEAMTIKGVNPCPETWWINLLYLQNIVAPDRICLPYTWYLSLDMQLFWFSPLILYPLYRSPKFGLRLLSLLLVVSVVTPAIILAVNTETYTYLWMRLDMDFPKMMKNFSYYYIPTYNRACPYLVGILLGYDVATKRRHLTKVNVAINWIVTILLLLFCTWFNNRAYDSGFVGDWDLEIAATVLLRPCWSIASAWVIYACTQGYGGFATKFLSLPIFFPLSRLSYCIYLVHLLVQAITVLAGYESSAPSWISYILNGVFGDLVLSIGAAFVLNLVIEKPSIILTKILLDNRGRQPEAATPVKGFKVK